MNTAHRLTFVSSGTLAVISIAVVLVTAAISYYSWQRSAFRRAHGLQELLRFAIVAVVVLLFNQPEWIEEFRPDEQPTIAVLWDQSGSMETRDVVIDAPRSETSPPSRKAITRAEDIRALTDPKTWSELAKKLNVVVQPITLPDGAQGTDLHRALSEAPDRMQNLLGIVLVSDGDWNTGKPPAEAASRLRMKSIPVFAIATGSPTRLPDVELTNIDLPTFATAGKAVRIPLTIDSSLPREFLTTVTLETSTGEKVTKEVRVAAMGRTSDSIAWKPTTTGDFKVTVEITRHPDETITDNNEQSAPIAVREEKLEVLVVESSPRWEYRYLRNALSRDPGVNVSCLLYHPGLSKPGGGSKDYIKEFPGGLDELSKFDVVILGDVGVEDGQLTEEHCRLLKGLVEHQASGLVFMPGFQGRQFSLIGTELEDLYPVHLDDAQPGGWGSRTAGRFELTERGQRSLLTKLADTSEENVQVWDDLPGFYWHAPVVRAKAGTEVLAVHGEMVNEHGRMPLLVTRTFGAGKVLFMGTDGAWRWRKGVEDKYHYRFWGQVVRWMAYQRNMAKGESMRLFYTPDQPQIRQTLALHAHVMEPGGEPLSRGDVVARIVAPSGKAQTARFTSEGDEWGVYQGRYVPEEPGQHDITLSCRQTGATLNAKFFVQGDAIERVGRPARPEVLEEIANVTKGRMVKASDLDEIMSSLASLPTPPPSIRRLALWSHPLSASIVIALLGAFWIWRKAMGLI